MMTVSYPLDLDRGGYIRGVLALALTLVLALDLALALVHAVEPPSIHHMDGWWWWWSTPHRLFVVLAE